MSRLGVALLAAGQSRRFGPADKLLADFRGRPLCLWAAHAARAVPAEAFWAITPTGTSALSACLEGAGFDSVENRDAASGQSTSIRRAAERAERAGLDRLLIILADMPFVSTRQMVAVADAAAHPASRPAQAVMSRAGATLLPPACFGSAAFPTLKSLTGDSGARAVFSALTPRAERPMPAHMATDLDTHADWKAVATAKVLAHG
ncbi:MAG: NTP transferase domain-containing protein [Pseudomonadota bacterium]